MWNEGLVLFACQDVDIAVIEAIQYIKDMELTKDDVRIVRRNGQVLVILKRNIDDSAGGD